MVHHYAVGADDHEAHIVIGYSIGIPDSRGKVQGTSAQLVHPMKKLVSVLGLVFRGHRDCFCGVPS